MLGESFVSVPAPIRCMNGNNNGNKGNGNGNGWQWQWQCDGNAMANQSNLKRERPTPGSSVLVHLFCLSQSGNRCNRVRPILVVAYCLSRLCPLLPFLRLMLDLRDTPVPADWYTGQWPLAVCIGCEF